MGAGRGTGPTENCGEPDPQRCLCFALLVECGLFLAVSKTAGFFFKKIKYLSFLGPSFYNFAYFM